MAHGGCGSITVVDREGVNRWARRRQDRSGRLRHVQRHVVCLVRRRHRDVHRVHSRRNRCQRHDEAARRIRRLHVRCGKVGHRLRPLCGDEDDVRRRRNGRADRGNREVYQRWSCKAPRTVSPRSGTWYRGRYDATQPRVEAPTCSHVLQNSLNHTLSETTPSRANSPHTAIRKGYRRNNNSAASHTDELLTGQLTTTKSASTQWGQPPDGPPC